jgi:diguanylate cyclase (GGDEF)-like protein
MSGTDATRPPASSSPLVLSMQDERSSRLIFLVEENPQHAQLLAAQVSHYGYTVNVFSSLAALESVVRLNPPSAIVMDLDFPEGKDAAIEAVAAVRRDLTARPLAIFVSADDDLATRLQAVRAGGDAYFRKPVDLGAIVDALDRLASALPPVPYRVAIVDDSLDDAHLAASYLRLGGMETRIISRPADALNSLLDFSPELILMDTHMEGCTGIELARVIRQIESLISVPIVFLSADEDRDMQLQVVALGGDDFLVKPVKPEQLASAVSSRVERFRKLRNLMVHDGLTGLLNHLTIQERLSQEVARAARQKQPLCYAMLDIDHFKSVNDRFGHAAGDRVLRSLAKLLSGRLRRSDSAGRYGGEEFAVVLPDTGFVDGIRVMDELRVAFSRIVHKAGDAEFVTTFSCGVAHFPECSSPVALSQRADGALYAAKEGGRNRVVASRPQL